MSSEPEDVNDKVHPVATALFGWVGLKNIGNIIFYGLAIASVILIGLDFIIGEREEEKVKFAKNYGFYGIYGFVAFAFVVLMGHPLGKLLRRGENYYDDQDEDEESGA